MYYPTSWDYQLPSILPYSVQSDLVSHTTVPYVFLPVVLSLPVVHLPAYMSTCTCPTMHADLLSTVVALVILPNNHCYFLPFGNDYTYHLPVGRSNLSSYVLFLGHTSLILPVVHLSLVCMVRKYYRHVLNTLK